MTPLRSIGEGPPWRAFFSCNPGRCSGEVWRWLVPDLLHRVGSIPHLPVFRCANLNDPASGPIRNRQVPRALDGLLSRDRAPRLRRPGSREPSGEKARLGHAASIRGAGPSFSPIDLALRPGIGRYLRSPTGGDAALERPSRTFEVTNVISSCGIFPWHASFR
jgi:hypothetical protein